MRNLAVLAVGVVGLAAPSVAQEPKPSKDGRTVFVPYEDFNEVLRQHAKGVLLTRAQFAELRRRAKAQLNNATPRAPKLESAEYTAQVRDDAVVGRVTFTIKSAGKGVQMMPLGLHVYHGLWSATQSLALENARVRRWRRPVAAGVALVIVLGNVSVPLAVLVGLVK